LKPSASFQQKYAAYQWRLHRNVVTYVILLLCLMGTMGWAEHQGLSRNLIGPIFLFSTVMIYAFIGVAGRTSNAEEYYVAGRRIPAFYNGMATAADWMSAASFISLSGALYLQGLWRSSRRFSLRHGMDWRILLGGLADCTAFAVYEFVHLARLFQSALWRPLA